MTLTEKVLKALESAEHYLENSRLTLNKDEKKFADSIWHVAAELEYVLLLLSLISGGENDTTKWKTNPENRKIGADEMLTTIRELLRESKKALVDKNLTSANKCAYMARQYIFRIQGDFAKKKRGDSEK